MRKAGFIVHPVTNDPMDAHKRLAAKFPFLQRIAPETAYTWMKRVPVRALKMGVTKGIKSLTGAEVEMTFWGVPYSPEQMLKFKPVRKVIAAARYCEQRGAEIIGLGAYTSIIGDYGRQVASAIRAGITTGNSLTAATGVEGLLLAVKRMGHCAKNCIATVIGAGGSVGGVAAQLLADEVGLVYLVGRDTNDPVLYRLVETIGPERSMVLDLESALKRSLLVITVTSATSELEIEPEFFSPGAVICDIARPRDIAHSVAEARDDVLVIEGAILKVPGINANLGYDFGFPPGNTYGCMAETMVLALEGITTDYSLGKSLELDRVKEIGGLAKKHGFELAGFRSFERALPETKFDQVRDAAARRRERRRYGR
jgi:predicted amino acid dehydrogenase